ncbi:glycerate kinase [Beutenbergia cavernae DSM 12333]|uniref:Glycerate kinase n=1 Tax=Beutenbergia cavernae (strain ATCC BAA-8 / DSM 12333 / CCUG 43141 / JCM 11478 / NBRC 16432 / NCIMB 13614 / HKI 0122) TaxID=471853 RepID=C5BYZ3_BEUC1|nr:glycerate kinase [Beutenbergia cavernae]ACQ81108.1 glycerate kinase [Beutenbergia cavernae DSM 12333]
MSDDDPTRSVPRVVVAPDSFKGSLAAADVAAAMADGVRSARSDADVVACPMADGGEGTLDALLASWGVAPRAVDAPDALGRPGRARYGISADGRLGVLELAEASGLPTVADVAPRPRDADTTGSGVVARALLDAGVAEILVCLGGSASTDGGSGLLRGLGVRLLDDDGAELPPGGGGLARLAAVDDAALHPRARAVRWRLAVDVTNPLLGPAGAAAVYGPQKGAAPDDVAALDAALARWAAVIGADPAVPGTGAAGGVPAGLLGVLGADCVEITAGGLLVAEAVGLPVLLTGADLVLTGEGALDDQSVQGKVVGTIAELAGGHVPVVAIAGRVELDAGAVARAGLTAAFSIAPGPVPLETLLPRTAELVRETAAHVARLALR